MLSILIPIYNYNVTDLVTELNNQSAKLNIEYEILLVDDFSTLYKEKNSELNKLTNVTYIELKENYGRAKIRNYLAEIAKYEHLIYLDCDSGIVKIDFIEKYIDNINNDIVYGGRIYQEKPALDFYFHWFYGTYREAKSLEKRKINPNAGFQTNNFLIKKNVFDKIKFNENLKGYGHEDTLFGYHLKQNDIQITHIDNPIIHLGLETTDEFIRKSLNGIKNLQKILDLYPEEIELFDNIKLLKYFFIIKKMYFCFLFKAVYKMFNKFILRNLKGKRPKLYLFDMLKISFLCSINK